MNVRSYTVTAAAYRARQATPPGCCTWCGKPVPEGREYWCSRDCYRAYARLYRWSNASRMAIRRAKKTCAECGRVFPKHRLRVHHIVPHVIGEPHIQANLRVLCKEDHDAHHRRERAALLTKKKVLAKARELRTAPAHAGAYADLAVRHGCPTVAAITAQPLDRLRPFYDELLELERRAA